MNTNRVRDMIINPLLLPLSVVSQIDGHTEHWPSGEMFRVVYKDGKEILRLRFR